MKKLFVVMFACFLFSFASFAGEKTVPVPVLLAPVGVQVNLAGTQSTQVAASATAGMPQAGSPSENKAEVVLYPFYRYTDTDGNIMHSSGLTGGRVAEYDALRESFGFKAAAAGNMGNIYADYMGYVLSRDDMFHGASVDGARYLRTKATFKRFYHRLDNDPLTNVEEHEEFVFDNNAAGMEMALHWEEFKLENDIAVPSLPGVKFNVDYRSKSERGHQASRAFEMCSVCHVDQQSQQINQLIEDVTFGINAKMSKGAFSYQHTERRFNARDEALTHVFTDPRGRLALDGPAPFAIVPDADKSIDKLKGKVNLADKATVSGAYTRWEQQQANLEAMGEGFKIKDQYGGFGIDANLAPGYHVGAKFRKEEFDNQVEGSMSRDKTDFTLYGTARPGSLKGVTLRGKFDIKKLDRTREEGEPLEVEDFIARTKEWAFELGANVRTNRKMYSSFRFKHRDIDDPLAKFLDYDTVNGAPVAGEVILSSLPEKRDEFFAMTSWAPRPKMSLSGNLTIRRDENATAGRNQDYDALSVLAWLAPAPKFDVTAGLSWMRNKMDTRIYIGTEDEVFAAIDNTAFKDRSLVFSVHAAAHPHDRTTVWGSASFADSKQDWMAEERFDSSFHPISSFTDLDILQTNFQIGADVGFKEHGSFFIKYRYDKYEDTQFASDDGKAQSVYAGMGLTLK